MSLRIVAGQPATIRSDTYALGLILFEIFTGKRTFDAKTMADLIRQHESGAIATPSSVVRDLDPAVERVILRCLEKDPARRSEEHTSELQSHSFISYAVFCLK